MRAAMSVRFETFSRVEDIDKHMWNRLAADASPLMDWEYLYALEKSGSVSEEGGYRPFHIVAYWDEEPIAIAPLYIRDRAWVEFGDGGLLEFLTELTGIPYHVGVLGTVPFTPVPGYQFLHSKGIATFKIYKQILQYIDFFCSSKGFATSRIYFLSDSTLEMRSLFVGNGYIAIKNKYYLWFNRNFRTFDDYLLSFKSSRRTKIKRELRTVRQQDIEIRMIPGTEVPESYYEEMYDLYLQTWIKHMGRDIRPFLNRDFFQLLEKNFRHRCSFSVATQSGKKLAMALFYYKGSTLYGRYWGCYEEIPFLHFATCYYYPIEYAIREGYAMMDPGFGGEHKLIRGYEVVPVYHYIKFHGKKQREVAETVMQKLRAHYTLPFESLEDGQKSP